MQYLNKRFSVNGPQTTAGACEACVYGRGYHEVWCDEAANDSTVESPANDANLDLLRAEVGAAAEPAVSGEGAGAGAQVPYLRGEVYAYPGQENVREMIRVYEELNRNRRDYVPAVGGCSCGGKNG